MVKKLSIRFRIKPVIDALREGKKTWSELKELKPTIPDKTLDRILKEYLQYWGLVRKKDGFWIWYENLRVFNSSHEFKLAIEHSKKMGSAFDNMLLCYFDAEDNLFNSAKEHLRTGYPEINQKLTELSELKNEKNKELLLKYSQKITNLHEGCPNYEYHPFQLVDYLLSWNPKPENLKMKNEMLKELKPLPDIYQSFSEDISLLELKIKNGTPLEGSCFLCPKIEIPKETKRNS